MKKMLIAVFVSVVFSLFMVWLSSTSQAHDEEYVEGHTNDQPVLVTREAWFRGRCATGVQLYDAGQDNYLPFNFCNFGIVPRDEYGYYSGYPNGGVPTYSWIYPRCGNGNARSRSLRFSKEQQAQADCTFLPPQPIDGYDSNGVYGRGTGYFSDIGGDFVLDAPCDIYAYTVCDPYNP